MKKIIACLILMPIIILAARPAGTFGACGPAAPFKEGSVTINCEGLTKEQGDEIQKILDKIIAGKLDFNEVMKKLDELVPEVNPNAPKVAYTYNGLKRVIRPGVIDVDDSGMEIFNKITQLEQNKDWDGMLKLSEEQMKERPEWLTPYFAAGLAYLQLGQREKAIEMLDVFDRRKAGNTDYDPLNKALNEMLKILKDQ